MITELQRSCRFWFSRWPAFLALVGVTGLGVGANLIMFDTIDQLLLRPPAGIEEPRTLVRVSTEQQIPGIGIVQSRTLSFPEFEILTHTDAPLTRTASYVNRDVEVGDGTLRDRWRVAVVSERYFELLGVRPGTGNFTSPNSRGFESGIVLSHSYARAHFSKPSHALGVRLVIDGRPSSVVAIAPADFVGPDFERIDAWLPLEQEGSSIAGSNWKSNRNSSFLRVVSRLRETALRGPVAEQISNEFSNLGLKKRVILEPLGRAEGTNQRRLLRVSRALSAVAFLLLLVTTSNAANVLLSNYARRRKDIALRSALGAPARSIFFAVAADGVVIGLASTAFAWIVGFRGSAALQRFLIPALGWSSRFLTWKLALFSCGIALLTVTILCLLPWLQARRVDLISVLTTESMGSSSSHRGWTSAVLVIQAATTVLLLTGTGLFVESFNRLRTTNLGFDPSHVVVVDAGVTYTSQSAREITNMISDFRSKALYLPGIADVSLATGVPLRRSFATWVRLNGVDLINPLSTGGPYEVGVDDHFFSTLQVGIIRGRVFTENDLYHAEDVVIVNQTMAKQLWANSDPLSGCLVVGSEKKCRQVIGVVSDMKRENVLEPPTLQFFVPLGRGPGQNPTVAFVRTSGDPERATGLIVEALGRSWAVQPMPRVDVMSSLLDPELAAWRTASTIFGTYGLIAFVIASLGIIGVLNLSLSRRRRELAIRIALGASALTICKSLGQSVLRSIVVGAILGLAMLAVSWSFVVPLLYSVRLFSAVINSAAALALMIAVVLLLVVITAKRAFGIDLTDELKTS
jgi:putative ABC transport system permease protein